MASQDPSKRELNEIVFRRLVKDFSDPIFKDAFQSYKEIYNNAMAKGKGNLEPKSLAGNPIQLESTNMGSLFKNPNEYNEYFVSTKADGLRYMLMVGNKLIDKSRNIYFVDINLNFWIIEELPSIPSKLNIDKTLIDGEILFWGRIETVRDSKTREVFEYHLHKDKNGHPFIGFLAFDILYGPTNPDYVQENLSKIPQDRAYTDTSSEHYVPRPKFQLGSFGAMVGLKAQTLADSKIVRWPTTRRRNSLEQLLLNKESPLYQFLHTPTTGGNSLISVQMNKKDDVLYDIVPEHLTVFNFSIFVSPFLNMNKLFDRYRKGVYEFMIENLQKSIENQFFYYDIRGSSMSHNIHKLSLPHLPKKPSLNNGKGFHTDGLIFTPALQPYLVGPWTFCNNKQYKWKPVLTADFQVGALKFEKNNVYFYIGLVRDTLAKQANKMVPFIYKFSDNEFYTALISSHEQLKIGSIVECKTTNDQERNVTLMSDKSPTNYFFFEYVTERPDKNRPNADNTVNSIIKASNVDKEYDFVYNNSLNLKIMENVKNTGGYHFYKTNVTDLKIPNSGIFFNTSLPLIVKSDTSLEIGEVYSVIYEGIDEDVKMIFFKKVKITQEKEDSQSFAQHKFEEVYQIPGMYHKQYLPTVLDLIYIIKERSRYLSEEDQLKVLLSFGKNRLMKCLLQQHPLGLFNDEQRENMLDLIRQRQVNPELELELQIKFHDSRHAYSNCLISNFIATDYIPVPIIKSYGNVRTTYAQIGEDLLIPEESIQKTQLKSVNVTDDLFNYDFGLVLSEEKKVAQSKEKPTSYEYQNRYTITNLSKFWRVDIIEFGNAKENWESAKTWWENRPRTRVELEYAPGAYFKDIVDWDDPVAMNTFLKGVETNVTIEELRNKVKNHIIKLNKTDPLIILKDLASVLVKIFRVLDMDFGNIDRRTLKKNEQNEQKRLDSRKGHAHSVWKNMRIFNNFVKRNLIENAAAQFENPTLFDISVGRGGDLDKWYKAGIKKVRGIDPNEESIKEAVDRFEERNKKDAKFSRAKLDYMFKTGRITDKTVVLPKDEFEIISCQFTLHYFFESPEMLERVVRRVSEKLVPGGLFIGTTIIGERINQMNTEEVEINFIDDRSYNFKLKDIEESGNYFNIQDQVEYLVDFDEFVELCEKHGLQLKYRVSFEEMHKLWPDKNMKKYEKDISFMYDSFIFRKN